MVRDGAAGLEGLPRTGDIIGGKYRVDGVLGVGGMAVVLAATHVHLSEKVALKLVRPTQRRDAESYERFFREARVASRIRSEHVARVFDLGTSPDGTPYIAMEFLSGCDLATRIARGEVSVEDAAGWVMQAAEGVAEAHALGVVHRDLKPANLFLTSRSDGTPCVKVLDFGISKILDADAPAATSLHTTDAPPAATGDPSLPQTSMDREANVVAAVTDDGGRSISLTRSRARLGSPQYMAPEQMRAARDIDARCDVWALGTILYELLAKSPAFDADTLDDLAEAIAQREPTPLVEVRKDAPALLVDVVARCLQKSPRDRYADVAELARALAPLVPAGVESAARIARILHRPRPQASGALDTIESAPTVSDESLPFATPNRSPSATPAHARTIRAVPATIGVLAALIASTAIAIGVARSRRTSAPPPAPATSTSPDAAVDASVTPRRPVVAVLAPRDLNGRADAAWVATAAAEMLATDLSSAPGTRVAPSDRVARAAHDLALDEADLTSPEVLARVQRALGADYVVTGTYAVVPGAHGDATIRFDLALVDTKDGATRARAGANGTSSELFDVIERASTELRVALGGAGPTAQQIGEARAASPSNLEAVRLYSEGLALLHAGNAVRALPVLEQAARLAPDSPFVAWQHGVALRRLGRDADSAVELKKAFDLRGPLSREDQLRIEAAYREGEHDLNAAVECFRTLFGFFPDSVEYGFSYARALTNSGRPKDAWAPLQALRALSPSESDAVRIELQSSANAARLGDVAMRETYARAAVAKADAAALSSMQIEAHMQLGQTFQAAGSLDAALPEFERARTLAVALGDRSFEAGAITASADVYAAKGDFARAYPLYDDALARVRELGDTYRAAGILNTRAIAKYTQGELDGARAGWVESARLYETIGDREGVGHTTGNLANLYEDEGDLPASQTSHEKALGMLVGIGNHAGKSEELCNLVELALQRGDLAAAEARQTELEAMFPPFKRKLIEGIARELRGMIARQKDDGDGAKTALEQAHALHADMGAQPFLTDDELVQAELALDRGEAAAAEASARACADAYRASSIAGSEPVAHALVARALAAQGKGAEALAAAERAVASAAKTKRVLATLEAGRAKGIALGATGQAGAGLASIDAALALARAKGFVWEWLELRLARVSLRNDAAERASLVKDARALGFTRIARLAGP